MPDTRKNHTPGPGWGVGKFQNRECVNCTPPCQGGEVLHRRGYCSHSYCECTEFEPASGSLMGALDPMAPRLKLRKSSAPTKEALK